MVVLEKLWKGIMVLFHLILPPTNAITQNSRAQQTYGYDWWINVSKWSDSYLPDPLDLNKVLLSPVPLVLQEETKQKQIIPKIKTSPDKIQVILQVQFVESSKAI